jgi:hypothetical protein
MKRGIAANLGGDCVRPPIGEALSNDTGKGAVGALENSDDSPHK